MKRCIIQLPKIRVSAPGYDVDAAGPEHMLFHEDLLFTQPYFFTFVECPFASYTGTGLRDQTTSVTVPDITDDPIVILYTAASDSNVFPAIRDRGSGNDQDGYAVRSWAVGHKVISSTQIDVNFVKASNTKGSPSGAYMILMRKAS